MPTGGFSTQARSIEAFSAAAQWIIAIFIVLAGANFALMFTALVRRRRRTVPFIAALVTDPMSAAFGLVGT